MRVRVCVLFLSHEEKKEKRESALFVCADFYFVSSSSCFLGVWRSLRQQEKRDRPVHKKKEREKKREFSCGSKKRDFSDDDRRSSLYSRALIEIVNSFSLSLSFSNNTGSVRHLFLS